MNILIKKTVIQRSTHNFDNSSGALGACLDISNSLKSKQIKKFVEQNTYKKIKNKTKKKWNCSSIN